MNKKITIYTSKTCGYCNVIKQSLEDSYIQFTEIDTTEYKDVWDSVKSLTSISATPIVEINNEFLLPGRDFISAENLIGLILNFKESQYSESRRALELIKTLNYNTYTAFNRLSAVLQQIENKLNKEENVDKSTS